MPETPFLGLRTVVYHVNDLARARAWYQDVLGIAPYFDQPFYVGFNVGGYEFGLHPPSTQRPSGAGGAIAYWGVRDVEATFRRLVERGATAVEAVQDVGEGIQVASVTDPFGNLLGLIHNPHFKPAA
jgi:predicted enzyme related to lactoylglutathione lyase